jgi:hypothetical protein
MLKSAAFALTAVCAFSALAGEGFRWRIDEVNEVLRPDIAGSANLSAIAWVSNSTYIAVTDRNSVMWELDIPFDHKTGKLLSCNLKRMCSPELTVDVEGLAIDPFDGSVWLADEWAATIRQYRPATGKALAGKVNVPESLKGSYRDSGFESLTISRDGLSMWMGAEEALKSDGPRANRKHGTDIRLTKFRRASAKGIWTMDGQWVYSADSIAGGPWYNEKKRDISRSGISEMCLSDDGTVLVLEREFSVALIPRLRCRIYETDMSSAKNVMGRKNLSGLEDSEKVKKRLLYETTGFSMYEGMCLGPVLEDGSRMLVLVSDADKKSFKTILSLRLSRRE